MSFNGFQTTVQEGDTVVLYLSEKQIYCIEATIKALSKKGIEIDNVFQTPYGALKCSDLIGKKFGTKIELSKGYGYILQPTPEFWTEVLPHRTQIIYTPDISMIIFQMEIYPGSIVVESGTGSGSLSHSLIRRIKPNGHLYTYDFHETRVNTAIAEFKSHGLGEYVTVKQRDVCTNGFDSELNGKVDSVFLDLPQPWIAAKHVINLFKSTGGRLCSFSPCIEQVQKLCLFLTELGFQDIETKEVLQTQYMVQEKKLEVIDLDFLKYQKDDQVETKPVKELKSFVTCVPPNTQAGHTGFITLAIFPPLYTRKLISINS